MLSDEVVLVLHEYGLTITENIFNYLYDHEERANGFNDYVLGCKDEPLIRMRFYALKRSSDDYSMEKTARKIEPEEQGHKQSLSILGFKQEIFLGCNASVSKLANSLPDSEVSTLNPDVKSDVRLLEFIKPSVKIDRVTVYSKDIWSKQSSFLSVLSEFKNSNELKEKIKQVIYNNPTIPFEDLFNPFLIDKYIKRYGEQKYFKALDVLSEVDFRKISNPIGYFITMLEK
ncbi:MAG: hypothetical protein N4Q32_01060 [Neisseriaceae bacterium]|nr:hypothetical protein [Neisseriaceae bacterium PsAf]MCV2502541.1 hypothetical protein [Neisseriaceae bacterium]MCV2509012.1 hypothetical protein [Neisseriaceae bacterium]